MSDVEFVCKLFPSDGEDWDDHGNYLVTQHTYFSDNLVEAAMMFYKEEGEFPDYVVSKNEDKGIKYFHRLQSTKELEKELSAVEARLDAHIESREKAIKAVQELFHAAMMAKAAVSAVTEKKRG